jgi:beta-N-acetylhexosaminidase
MNRYLLVLVLLSALPAPLCAMESEPSLRAMLGQMMLIGFRGTELSDDAPILRDIREHNLGGVILFNRDVQLGTTGRNIESPGQVRALTARLQSAAATPLLVAVDQEGGRVRRLREETGFPFSPSARTMGAGTPDATRIQGKRTGELLAGLGINLNFAPVADVDVNPESPAIGALDRSFSPDPEVVAAHARAFSEGLRTAGVIPCLKHFPGHGSASADSHLGLTDISETWSPTELIPYERLIPGASMVMTGHLFLRRFDAEYPCTLSPAVVTGLLRDRLGFQGVVVSDDMQMRAITAHYGLEEALVRAVLAGVDILIFGNNLDYDPDIVPRAIDILARGVEDGRLTRARIAASFGRIAAAKGMLAAPAGHPPFGKPLPKLPEK